MNAQFLGVVVKVVKPVAKAVKPYVIPILGTIVTTTVKLAAEKRIDNLQNDVNMLKDLIKK